MTSKQFYDGEEYRVLIKLLNGMYVSRQDIEKVKYISRQDVERVKTRQLFLDSIKC